MTRELIPPSGINQYTGINAHLNDRLQLDGREWEAFHDRHIGAIQDQLNETLMPRGYIALTVPGLQIRNTLNNERWHSPTSDGTLWDTQPDQRPPVTPQFPGAQEALAQRVDDSVEVIDTLSALGKTEEQYLNALGIYDRRILDEKPPYFQHGKPCAWLELLSPSNKPLAHDPDSTAKDEEWQKYDTKRTQILGAGIPLVEIDYLNSTLPLPGLTPYIPIPEGKVSPLHPEEGSPNALEPHPYNILVTDPTNTSENFPYGTTTVHGFDADQPIPLIEIPILGNQPLPMSFQSAYNKTAELPHLRNINYAETPALYETYRADDQDRLAARIETLIESENQGFVTGSQKQPIPLIRPAEGARDRIDNLLQLYQSRDAPGNEQEIDL